jgi:hypothetical protein
MGGRESVYSRSLITTSLGRKKNCKEETVMKVTFCLYHLNAEQLGSLFSANIICNFPESNVMILICAQIKAI